MCTLPVRFLAARRVRACLLYNERHKARLSTSGRLQDNPFIPTQSEYTLCHFAHSIEVGRQYHLLRASDLAKVKMLWLPTQVEHYATRLLSVRTSIREDIALGCKGYIGTRGQYWCGTA